MTDRERLEELHARPDAVIYAKDIAKIIHQHPGEIVRQAKSGEWDTANGTFIRSGRCIKFNRADFVAKWRDRV